MAPATYTLPLSLSPLCVFCSVIELASGGAHRFKHNSPAQWPLAPPAVILSAGLVAYYDHIRASAGHGGFMSLCPPLRDPQKVPNLLCQSLIPCRCLYSGGSSAPTDEPARLTLAFTHPVGVRQPLAPHTGLRVVCLTKLQHSLNAAARNLACPASGRDVYDRACVRRIAPPHVGYDYMNSRLIHGRTRTGCSDSIMGCTQDEQDKQDSERTERDRVGPSLIL